MRETQKLQDIRHLTRGFTKKQKFKTKRDGILKLKTKPGVANVLTKAFMLKPNFDETNLRPTTALKDDCITTDTL